MPTCSSWERTYLVALIETPMSHLDAWGGPFAATKGLVQDFGPDRIRDAPISEAGFVGAAVGAAH